MEPRILQVRTKILKANDTLARSMRSEFLARGIFVSNWVSSPGSGKTELLERTLSAFIARGSRVAAIVGDLETERDADRLRRSGAPVRQIMTHGLCHLEAEMILKEWEAWGLGPIDYLFIENVGNLVCPTTWDLGESLRVGLFSVTEGEDKPLKYPGLFNTCDVAVYTKMDLAGPCEFDRELATRNLIGVRPGIEIIATSAKTGEGFEDWMEWLTAQRSERLSQRG